MEESYLDQPIITRYSDHESVGSWKLNVPKNCGIMKPNKQHGNMHHRTIKFKGKDGAIKLGKEYFHKDQ